MDLYEEAVLQYICSGKKRFLNPQYEIEYDKETSTGGSLPDFVVLDFEVKKIYVVEVTTSYSVQKLLGRVAEAESRWITPLAIELEYLEKFGEEWQFHTTLFVRDERVEFVRANAKGFPYKNYHVGVSVISLKLINEFLGNRLFESNFPLENIDK